MTVQLLRPYQGLAAGAIVTLPPSTEEALISQRLALTSAATITAGNATNQNRRGRAAIAAGQSSVVITNAGVNPASNIEATVSQAAADATLTSVVRVVPAAGSFTIHGNANATAATVVQWSIVD
jgi:hypothetical protein